MSKIDEMLKNEKVEWKKLGDVCEFKRGKSITKKNVKEGNIPVIAGGQKPAYYHSEFNRSGQTITVAGSGAYAGFLGFWEEPIFLSDAFSIETCDLLNKKYLYYYLLNMQDKIYDLKKGSGIPHVYGEDMARLMIAIPSLEIQEKIVNYLDKFTNYKENIKQELQKELNLRNKQYEFYRDKLLSEEYLNKLISNYDLYKYELKETTLGELCDTRNGYTPSKSNKEYWENGEIPWFRLEDIRLNGNILNDSTIKVNKIAIKNSLFKRNSIILSTSATIGEHALIEVDFLANQRFTVFTVKNEFERLINIKFFYYYFYVIDNLCKKYLKLGNFASVDIDKLKNSKIFIPPIEIQEKIAEILDKFQAITQDVSGLLPDEIEKREKQYEYYREKLLTFDTECTSGGGTTY